MSKFLRRVRTHVLLGSSLLSLALPAQAQNAGDLVTLRPGDVIRVAIWREPDLSGDFQVDVSGAVTLPLLGERRVVEIPMARLREVLMDDYLRQLRNPSITITPLRRVNILGEVARPGLYPVDPTVTLLGALALAGGANPEGDLNRVSLVRSGTNVERRLPPGGSLDQLDVRSGDQIIVGRRTWGSRYSATLFASLLSLVGSVVTTVIIINSNN